jgi:peptide/nickel transport system permease protein
MEAQPTPTFSPNQKAYRRFIKNKPAIFGAFIIISCIVIALLGYLITPDQSPDAREQTTEIALKSPNFKVKMLKVFKNKPSEENSWWQTMLFGKNAAFDLIPLNNYSINDSCLVAYTFGGDTLTYTLPDVIAATSLKNQSIHLKDNFIFYTDFEEKAQKIDKDFAKKTIIENYIFEKTYLLGTDMFGRCMLSRLLIGVRISLLVGLIAVIISLMIGVMMGALAGYFGGRTNDVIMLIINVIWSIPTVLLVFAIVLALGRGIGNIFLAVGLTMWVEVARLVRGQVASLRNMQYVEAAESFGFSSWRIILKHLLPNIIGPILVIAASNFATAILLEAGLSYLGFGIRPPTPSWGTMLNETYGYAISGKPILALIPAFAIMLLVLAFNLLGNGIRDALDVRSKI